MVRNVFEYLESAYTKIFSRPGLVKLRTAFIVGLASTSLYLLLFTLLGYFFYSWHDGDIATRPALLIGCLLVLFMLFLSLVESAFYAILIPLKFLGKKEPGSPLSFREDIIMYNSNFSKYFFFITYYSGVMLVMILLLFIVPFYFFYMEMLGTGTISIFIMLFLYIYVSVRLSIVWYHMLFHEGEYASHFRTGWGLLGGKVWMTFRKIFVFGFIVSTAAGIMNYIVHLFAPDLTAFSSELINLMVPYMEYMNTSFEGVSERVIEMFHKYDAALISFFLIFALFNKVARLLSIAMKHVFLTEYMYDVTETERGGKKAS